MSSSGSASIPSSVVNLSKGLIGVGIVSLPQCFAQTGLWLGALLLVCCAALSAYALHLLALCVLKARDQGSDASFRFLAKAAFGGHQAASALVPITIAVEGYGITAAYFVCIGDLLPEVAAYFGNDMSPWNSRTFWITAVGWCVELPLAFPLKMDSLKFSSIVGQVGVMYIVLLFCLFASGTIALPPPKQSATFWPPPHSTYTSAPGIFEAIAIFVFSLICSLNVPTLILELRDSTMRRIDTVICAGVGGTSCIYVLVGVCGSLAFGASVDGNSLKSFPNMQGTTAGFVSIFARLAIVVNLMGSIPLYMHPLRENVTHLLFGKTASDLRLSVRGLVTLSLFILTWGSALVVPRLDLVMAFVGSTTHMITGFTLPAFFYLLYFLSKGSQGEDNVGVSLQTRGSADRDADVVTSFSPSRGTFKKSALVMLVVSLVVIPVLLTGEACKIANET